MPRHRQHRVGNTIGDKTEPRGDEIEHTSTMTTPRRKRLIEVAFPLEEVSTTLGRIRISEVLILIPCTPMVGKETPSGLPRFHLRRIGR